MVMMMIMIIITLTIMIVNGIDNDDDDGFDVVGNDDEPVCVCERCARNSMPLTAIQVAIVVGCGCWL